MPPNIEGSYGFNILFLVMGALVRGLVYGLLEADVCLYVMFCGL